MRSDDSTAAQRVNRLIDQGRGPEPPAPGPEYDPWPAGWPSEKASPEPDSGDLRARLTDGFGSRWQVTPRAVAAVAVLALLIVLGAAVVVLRGPATGTAVPARAPAPLGDASTAGAVATGAATSPPVTAAAVGTGSVGTGSAGRGVGPLRVYVVGQVRRPGVVSLAEGARVEDAVQAVGGATGKADLAVMNLARKVVDGERIIVPRPGEKLPTPDPVTVPGAADPGATGDAGNGAAPGAPIDLNTATVAQLDTLPGVGPVLAGRIVAWRQENGRFSTVDDLGEVQGIGDATLAKLRPLVRV